MAKAKQLVIVESPAKSKTIKGYLGADFDVIASYGHVRDLPKSKLGVDLKKDFAPEYIIPRKQAKNVSLLKKMATARDTIWLATDLDREGEAIAWHIAEILRDVVSTKTAIKRITFDEITKPAILGAIEKPGVINQDKVDAQQARRVLDRLVGYTLSPLLWKKLYKGLSAGRVQSVALKFIVDREREREKFKSREYWTLEADLKAKKGQFTAGYIGKKDVKPAEYPLGSAAETEAVKTAVTKAPWKVDKLDEQEQIRRPKPPFITSTLQQAASNVLGFTAKRTMSAAQRLYEGGYITYMRTDSLSLSAEAVREIRAVIQKEYGDQYVPDKAAFYKSKKSAQEAHEAIRPTHVRTKPETIGGKMGADEVRLYDLIWRRTLAAQMNPARVKKTSVDVVAKDQLFRANGLILLFDGHFRALGKTANEVTLPLLKEGETVELVKLTDERHETEPPARYTEASLIKALEEAGVGRPSTYAPTISTLYARLYIQSEGRALVPQDVGKQVIDFLVENFPKIVDVDFTANMEDDLDKIAAGKSRWQPIIKTFWQPFAKLVKEKESKIEKVADEILDEKCPLCGKQLVIKNGRFGKFKACSGWPDCKYTQNILTKVEVNCPVCNSPLAIRRTKRGKNFYGCSAYPKCKFALWDLTIASLDKKLVELTKEKTATPYLEETRAALITAETASKTGK